MKKDVYNGPEYGRISLLLLMATNYIMETPTAVPHLKADYTAVPVETTVKTTQGKVVTCYFAKEQIVCEYLYNTKTYEIGEQLNGYRTEKGLAQTDGYGMMKCETIPWQKIIQKDYITVREHVTTTWEIIEK